MIWHDDGQRNLETSLKVFTERLPEIGEVQSVKLLDTFVGYPLRIKGTTGEIWLSSTKAAEQVLSELDYPVEYAQEESFRLGKFPLEEDREIPEDWELSELALQVLEAIQELYDELGRIPKVREISERAGYMSDTGADWRIGELVKHGKVRKNRNRGGIAWFEGMD